MNIITKIKIGLGVVASIYYGSYFVLFLVLI